MAPRGPSSILIGDPSECALLKIDSDHWVFGLHWSSYGVAKFKGELESEAKKIAATHIVTPKKRALDDRHSIYDYGFAVGKVPSKHSYSVAATLAAVQYQHNPRAWSAVYALPNGLFYWIGVLDGGSPAPAGEVIGDWDSLDRVITAFAVDFGVQCERRSFDQLVDQLKSAKRYHKFPLVPINRKRNIIGLYFSVAFMACLMALIYFLNKRQHSIDVTSPRVISNLSGQNKAPQEPLEKVVDTASLIARCKAAIYRQPVQAPGGWNLSYFECTNQGTLIRWTGGESFLVRPVGEVSADGKTIEFHSTYKKNPEYVDWPGPSALAELRLRELSKNVDAEIRFTNSNRHRGFVISTELAPWQLPLEIAGTYLTRLVFENSQWQIFGEI